jgi:hypothetical protein
MKKIPIVVCVLIAIILSFAVGAYEGHRWTKMNLHYVRLKQDIDFEKDGIKNSTAEIQGIIKKGSLGMEMNYPYVTETVNKTIYFPIVIPYEKKELYEAVPLPRKK